MTERRGNWHPRSSAINTMVATTETAIEPRQPKRFEKKKNMPEIVATRRRTHHRERHRRAGGRSPGNRHARREASG